MRASCLDPPPILARILGCVGAFGVGRAMTVVLLEWDGPVNVANDSSRGDGPIFTTTKLEGTVGTGSGGLL